MLLIDPQQVGQMASMIYTFLNCPKFHTIQLPIQMIAKTQGVFMMKASFLVQLLIIIDSRNLYLFEEIYNRITQRILCEMSQEQIDKKSKKRKHDRHNKHDRQDKSYERSRSHSQRKKHKRSSRSRSREQKKKDKKKKDRRQYENEKGHRKRSHSEEKILKNSKPREKSHEVKQKSKSKDKERSPSKRKDRKQDEGVRRKSRSRSRDSGRLEDKKKNHKRDKYDKYDRYDRHDYKNTKYDKYDRYDRYDKRQEDDYRRSSSRMDRKRSRERMTFSKDQGDSRIREQSRRGDSRERYNNVSRRQRDRDGRNTSRRDRRPPQSRFRFDSPPKSDESDMSDDPEKMQKLNRMKAEKQLVTSKADRKLYLGNLPPNITSQQLMDMLNAALKKMEINTEEEGDSIISAWISPDGVGHYAFVEFRSPTEATNGLTLNGASLFGYQLKLGRPKQYIEYNKQLLSEYGTDSNIDTIMKKVEALGGENLQHKITERITEPPSRIVLLKHIVTVEELAIDEEFEEIYEDVMDMAKRFGDVVNLTIPRPHEVMDLEVVQKRVKGLGYVLIEYKTVEQAVFARKKFIQKQFSGRSVTCGYFSEERFQAKQFDIQEKIVITF